MWLSDVLNTSNYFNISYIHSQEECESMLEIPGLKSNVKDFASAFNHSLSYDASRKSQKNKIYGVLLKIQFPRMSSVQEQDDFVTRFMSSLKNRKGERPYKSKIPYVYWFASEGLGDYVNILALQREVFVDGIEIQKVYKKTTYVNRITGKFCQKDDPEVVVFKRNDAVLDTNGSPILQTMFVSEKKDTTFNFLDSHDENLKTNRFNYFIYSMKQLVKKTLYFMNSLKIKPFRGDRKKLSYYQTDTTDRKAKVLRYNLDLSKIREIESLIRWELINSIKSTRNVVKIKDLNIEYIKKNKSFKKLKKRIDVMLDKHSRLVLDKEIDYSTWDQWFSEDIENVQNRLTVFAKDNFGFAGDGFDAWLESNQKMILNRQRLSTLAA